MSDHADNLNILSTERRVWLLLVEERDDEVEPRVGSRIEEMVYTVAEHSDAMRLIQVSERADEAWQTAGPVLLDDSDGWRITFSRPIAKAEWYVAGSGGETPVSSEVVARLDAIADEPSEAELERIAENVGVPRWEQVQR